jgi:hypothetical protein
VLKISRTSSGKDPDRKVHVGSGDLGPLGKTYEHRPGYYVEKIEDKPYILMEYIIGEEPSAPELSSWIRGKALNLSLSLNSAIQFCSGMLHAQKKFEAMQRPRPSRYQTLQHHDNRDRIVKVRISAW